MKTRILITLLLLLVGLGCGGTAQGERPSAKPARSIRVLFLAQEREKIFRLAPAVAVELKKQGIASAWHASLKDLTPKLLSGFNVVILYQHRKVPRLTAKIRRGISALRAHVAGGGGLLVTKDLYSRRGRAFYKELLQPLGAEVLLEQLVERAPAMTHRLSTMTSPAGLFAWTDSIKSGHPATLGVRGLYYNIGRWEPGEPGSLPIKVDKAWTVLARGSPTAATLISKPTGFDPVKHNKGPGSYTRSPPLLAVRTHGKGRIALWPTLASFTLLDGYSRVLEGGLVMRSNHKGKPSDGARLTYNLIRWLAGPRPTTAAGGPFLVQPLLTNRVKIVKGGRGGVKRGRQRGRSRGKIAPALANAYKGLIGAFSKHSGGAADPGRIIAAARRAGYSFIAFAEDLSRLNSSGWERLVKTCREASGDKFTAIPGLRYQGADGDSFIVLGEVGFPPDSWADPRVPGKRVHHNGTLRMALDPVPPIIHLPLKQNHRPSRLHSSFFGYAVQVWAKGKLQVDDLETYYKLQKEGLGLFSTAVHLVDSPASVAAAARKGLQAWIRADSPDKVLESIQGLNKSGKRFFKPAFASSGPEIGALTAANWGTTDLALPGKERIRVKLLVRAARGLAEVKLLDGGKLVRRFLPGGDKELSTLVDSLHDRQHSFVVVATDGAGGRAISWSRNTNVQELSLGMAGDNMNDLGPVGKTKLDRGRIRLRGTEHAVNLLSPGAIRRFPGLVARLEDGTRIKPAGRHAAMKRSLLVSRFGAEVEYGLDRFWDGPGLPGGAYSTPLVDNPYYSGTMRQTTLARLPPGPNLVVREFNITLKKTVKLAQTPGVVLFSSSNRSLPAGALDHVVLPDGKGGQRVIRPSAGKKKFSSLIQPGSYAAIYPMLTVVFPLDQPVRALLLRNSSARAGKSSTVLQVGVGERGDLLAAGKVIKVRLAMLVLPMAAQGSYSWLPSYRAYWSSRKMADEVNAGLGLNGAPAYKIEPNLGKVLGTRLVLSLASDGGGFSGRISKAALPLPLPVRLQGLNPKWSAGLWYRGTNRILRTEWPPGWRRGRPVHHRYVQLKEIVDPYIPLGVGQDGAALFQLDLQDRDRDIFAGNPVTCDRVDFGILFIWDAKRNRALVRVHNPTDRAATVTLRPGKGFDMFGDFTKVVKVDSGKTVAVRLKKVSR